MCETCGKSFASKEYLKHHNRIHTGSKPYKCEMCFRTFAQRNSLYQHVKVHTGMAAVSRGVVQSSKQEMQLWFPDLPGNFWKLYSHPKMAQLIAIWGSFLTLRNYKVEQLGVHRGASLVPLQKWETGCGCQYGCAYPEFWLHTRVTAYRFTCTHTHSY